jgi:hypothetical protein
MIMKNLKKRRACEFIATMKRKVRCATLLELLAQYLDSGHSRAKYVDQLKGRYLDVIPMHP